MKKNLRLLLFIPIIIFFVSVLVVFFSPVEVLPCETSATDPATSWDKTNCKGYYLTTNPTVSQPVENVNNSGFLINLVILICGSFLFNGILFLVLFIIVSLSQKKPRTELEKWDAVAALDDEPEQKQELTHKTGLFSKLLNNETYEEKFNPEPTQDETNK